MPSKVESASALTLDEVAEKLGVHYMTVYRYVRQGRLRAARVQGVWQVGPDALQEFLAERDASHRKGPGRRQSAGVQRRETYVRELERSLIAGDGRGASEVLQRAISSGADVGEVYVEILSPALAAIGDRWARGEIDIAVEHLATATATRLVGQFSPRFARPGRRRGVLVIGGPAGERHGLVLAMLADLLRGEGWDVRDLGPDTPAGSFVHAVQAVEDLVAVGISVSSNENLASARETLVALRDAVGDDVRLVVGGHAVRDLDHARELGADHWANGAREFASYLSTVRAP